MSAEIIPFNPLDKTNLGASVADALLARPAMPLGELAEFHGAGVYALYYGGKFKPYAVLTALNAEGQHAPIYVGKAVPAGARKGGVLDPKPGRVLFRRLVEHAVSIRATSNLNIADFHCRFLVVDDIWIPLGESLLIARFSPIWNSLIDGFGNHDPGSGRHAGMRPRWDVLHPGRPWAANCQERKESAKDIERDVASFLANLVG
ncbi:MAG: Eco29kI family restriction endonuclease [Rhodocyclaceae bacterium]|nr:Eco29kI family restriction endonuclease [Rhodocyclaceae bacterium]